MTNKILTLLKRNHALVIKSVGEFETFKAKGMTFNCRAYEVCGLGHVSVMQAKGFFGLMKMDTLIVAPEDKDLPLLSYDRIYAMGNDTLIIELYDTMGEKKVNLSSVVEVKEKYAHLPERFAKGEEQSHWYDDIRLPETTSKKGKKANSEDFDAYALDYVRAYLKLEADDCDRAEKIARTEIYASGLISQGGPATDVFKKEFGEEKTGNIIRKVLFGTK
ncbi:MAG: hypothetical protein IKA84_02115 [Clostridia bacterium]|nr:hypothetical protein [Clostridia bacterium]